ncbi:phage portal protein [Planomonospora sp. ID82291]|uniref:phage portal protein n=1 Tax=Planomonospora sp. ID82291 TaxID=2738136 RepID=UPI0018C3A6EE|nr:phage portal protein [Planomonospora sp. ID82291]MBG0818971.1 phage portal protein [Planomonospora sp. ID82291]
MARTFLPGLLNRAAAPALHTTQSSLEMELKQLVPNYGAVAVSDWSSNLSAAARRAWPVERAVAEAFERVVWVFKACDSIAEHQANLDYIHRDPKTGEIIEDDPLVELLNDGQANELETGRQFRYRLSAQILLSPRGAFVEMTFDRRGRPIRLDLLPPGRTRPVPGKNGVLLSHFETITPDGTRVPVPAERVRWFRKPHPTDPYMGITPLQAAGLSVDQDFLAKIYNNSFMLNDGRPGGILSVEGRTNETDARKLEERFGRGPAEAGKLTVIGGGKLSYVDLAATPRDMAYGEMAARAKEEVLAAYGVGETVLGNSSGRTWDNAEQELFTFWTITMPPHLRILTTGFSRDAGRGIRPEFDTSTVEVLRRTAEARRREAREEVKEGLISPDEYRQIAEYEPYDLPHTRAIYIGMSRTPIPTRPEDAAALGLASPAGEQPPAAPDAPAAPGEPGEPGEEPAAEETAPGPDATPPGREAAPLDAGDPATQQAFAMMQGILDGSDVETKTLLGQTTTAAADDVRDQTEANLQGALQALVRRLVQRTAARVASPKARKGTRHFTPEYKADTRVGTAPLDAEKIADTSTWEEEAAAVLTPVLAAAAATVAGPGAAAAVEAAGWPVGEARDWLVARIVGAARRLGDLIRTQDAAGADIDRLVAEVRAQLPGLEEWAVRAGVQAATGLTHAVEFVVAQDAAGPGGIVSATWRTRRDGDVRPSHLAADGQIRRMPTPFDVGETRLRWPGDFTAPTEETANCRCRLSWVVSPGR